jgi:hypothetical protein
MLELDTMPVPRKDWQCDLCGRWYSSPYVLKQHVSAQHGHKDPVQPFTVQFPVETITAIERARTFSRSEFIREAVDEHLDSIAPPPELRNCTIGLTRSMIHRVREIAGTRNASAIIRECVHRALEANEQ